MQILSHTVAGPETLDPSAAVELARQARDPAATAAELEHAVRGHGFVGAMINGRVDGRYLGDTFFWPVFESAETLRVPIYLHPHVPPQPVIDACYGGLAPKVSARLAAAGPAGTSTPASTACA